MLGARRSVAAGLSLSLLGPLLFQEILAVLDVIEGFAGFAVIRPVAVEERLVAEL